VAVIAKLRDLDGVVSIRLRADETPPLLTEDEPPGWDASAPFYLLWDADKLDRGEWECWKVTAHLEPLAERHLAALDRLGLPRVDVPERGWRDLAVSEVLRRARDAYLRGRVVA
jgi:hypothetical protein